MTSFDVKDCLSTIWRAGVDAVSGQRLVAGAMQSDLPFQPDIVIAAGKAASSMCIGALSTAAAVGNSIVATKYGHVAPELSKFANVTVIEAGHPIPDRNSLLAGETILNAVQDQHQESRLLLLLSGGASALVEVLPDELELGTYRARTEDMIAAGMPIDEINDARKKASLIKGGKLLREFKGNEIRVYAISDVKGDDVAVIGSGLGDGRLANCAVSTRIVGSNAVARQFALDAAVAAGLTVRCNEESLYHDVFELRRASHAHCVMARPVFIFGAVSQRFDCHPVLVVAYAIKAWL